MAMRRGLAPYRVLLNQLREVTSVDASAGLHARPSEWLQASVFLSASRRAGPTTSHAPIGQLWNAPTGFIPHARLLHSCAAQLRSAQPQPVEREEGETRQPDASQHATAATGAPATDAAIASSSVSDRQVEAQQCDAAIGRLQQTHASVRRPPGYMPAHRHVLNFLRTAVSTMLAVLRWTAAVPQRVMGFVQLPAAGRREVYKGWWAVIRKEARHYWMGTKLLAADVHIATGLVSKLLQGKQLTRRERKQLTRTTADVFRFVPMLVFVVVPFMELLLPVALKLFPSMLPSTFEDKLKKEEEVKKRLNAKLEMAHFLQDTMVEMAANMKRHRSGSVQASAEEFYNFMKKTRAGEPVSTSDIMHFSKLFNDELTLDALERVQLVGLCKFVGLTPFGTDAFLRARLRAHLAAIKADDRSIKEEGIDNLTADELRQACRARGLRAPYGEYAIPFMRTQLGEWLDLSLNRALPSSLLLLSRAWMATQPVTPATRGAAQMESLKETLSSLPDDIIEEVGLEACVDGKDKSAEYAKRLEQLRKEQELIDEEAAAQMAAESRRVEEALPPPAPQTAKPPSAQQMTAAAAAAAIVREAAASAVAEVLDGAASEEERAAAAAAAKESRMRKVISALAVLASSSGVSKERERFMQLVRSEVTRLKGMGVAGSTGAMLFRDGRLHVDVKPEVQQAFAAKSLSNKVSGILSRIERELDDADEKIGDKLHVLDLDNDGIISPDELRTALAFLHEQLGDDELKGLLETLNTEGTSTINVNDLMTLARSDSGGTPSEQLRC